MNQPQQSYMKFLRTEMIIDIIWYSKPDGHMLWKTDFLKFKDFSISLISKFNMTDYSGSCLESLCGSKRWWTKLWDLSFFFFIGHLSLDSDFTEGRGPPGNPPGTRPRPAGGRQMSEAGRAHHQFCSLIFENIVSGCLNFRTGWQQPFPVTIRFSVHICQR